MGKMVDGANGLKEVRVLVIALTKLEGRGGGRRGLTATGRRREFHVSRRSRERYDFDESLFTLSGNVIFAHFMEARRFAEKINRGLDLSRHPEKTVKAGQLNGIGLMDEIFHHVIHLYTRQQNTQAMQQALDFCEKKMGSRVLNEVLERFVEEFPPLPVYKKEESVTSYLWGDNKDNRRLVLEEMLMLWLANRNPAAAPFRELFDDRNIKKNSAFLKVIDHLRQFFAGQPPFGPDRQPLVDMLQSPLTAEPRSISRQLGFVREKWGLMLDPFLTRLLQALDLLKEEEKINLGGPGSISLEEWQKRLAAEQGEKENFSPDTDWMPNLVMIAKSTYVWLDQLSRQYTREIRTLNGIPDEELDRLAEQGFSGLWLIGIWERSPASRKIKRLCGNPEAMASAYSIYRYRIAGDLGGEEALEDLKRRALARSIRLGVDMVPNHMGIDSPTVAEHPDWFIQLDHSPFPAYTFSGEDLSADDRVEIRLEDHYYDRTDAAVVFKCTDRRSGQVRYIYHGNDGTAMPWNDTAQLNYLLPEVREAVMRMIQDVARLFPIIRFDAAMTLSKLHYQRLWFPEPGSGGDIPTRAEYGLSRDDFDRHMPAEFWREVVDRTAAEAADTLLLAEAFWLMESYFVRTLGMHRVYNSAFMNLLKNEENRKYRQYIKNVLEFNPEILRRYVNFMNNPDEETAVAQFGKGDKYFGICVLMVTLPGLPMFGHGQIEGFTEKYGMEYSRAYWDEKPDEQLVRRHRSEIAPLLHKRYLFAGVEHFLLYDFFTADGGVDENILAYSNRSGGERCLIVYHNKFADTRGWVRMSAAYVEKTGEGSSQLRRKNLGEGLGLQTGEDYYVIFRDRRTDLEYIRPSREFHERGLYVELGAYQRHVFMDFREIRDNQWHHYRRLSDRLEGRGAADMMAALRETVFQPLHQALYRLLQPELLQEICRQLSTEAQPRLSNELRQKIRPRLREFLDRTDEYAGGDGEGEAAPSAAALEKDLPIIFDLYDEYGGAEEGLSSRKSPWAAFMKDFIGRSPNSCLLLCWWALHRLGESEGRTAAEGGGESGRRLIEEWQLMKVIEEVLGDMAFEPGQVQEWIGLLPLLVGYRDEMEAIATGAASVKKVIKSLFDDEAVRMYLRFNTHDRILWFHRESFETLVQWLCFTAAVEVTAARTEPRPLVAQLCNLAGLLTAAAAEAGHKVNDLLALVSSSAFRKELAGKMDVLADR